MTLVLDIPPEMERRLTEEAKRHGVSAQEYTVRILEKSLRPRDRRAELVSLIDSWIEDGDAQEQRETGDYLVRALDEDRLSDRKLFPPELKGDRRVRAMERKEGLVIKNKGGDPQIIAPGRGTDPSDAEPWNTFRRADPAPMERAPSRALPPAGEGARGAPAAAPGRGLLPPPGQPA